MNKDILHINNFEIEDIGSSMRKSSVKHDTLGTEGKRTFSNITEKNLFSDGMNVITQRFKDISEKLNNAQISILNNCDSIFNLEARLKIEALSIEIPKGFSVNDTITENSFDSRTYSKIDGQSVNMGNQTKAVDVNISSTINAVNLGNINNNNTVQGGQTINEYRSNSIGLKDISKASNLETQDLKFNGPTVTTNLHNISTSNTPLMSNIDMMDNSNIVIEKNNI